MKSYLARRWYTNFILTVIAILFAASLLAQYGGRLSGTSTAYAQEMQPRLGAGFSAPGKSAPVDTSNVATVQDLAVAGATAEVAAANREIASAIRELAKAVQDAANSISRAVSPPLATLASGRSGSPGLRET